MTTEQARKIRILEIKLDMAVAAERSARKSELPALAATTLALSNELGALYRAANK